MHRIAPDTTLRPGVQVTPTHFHCYRWSGSGQEWARLERTDTLDLNSPDRPPIRVAEWLNKSARLIAATFTDPAKARDWLIAEWDQAATKAMNPVPDWVDSRERGDRALEAIQSGCWPSYSQWLAGGVITIMAVVGTAERCH